jgi:hypothetical protein
VQWSRCGIVGEKCDVVIAMVKENKRNNEERKERKKEGKEGERKGKKEGGRRRFKNT